MWEWFRDFPTANISTLIASMHAFRSQWGYEDYKSSLANFTNTIKKESETICGFNNGFSKASVRIDPLFKAEEAYALSLYFDAFDSNLGLFLRKVCNTIPQEDL